MRRTLLMIAAVALLLTQCRKPAVELPTAGPANENMVSMTVTVGHGGKTDINGTTGEITWRAGDKLYVGDGEKYIGCLELQDGASSATGTFSGKVSTTTSTTFGFYYLGSGDYTTSLNVGSSTSIDIPFGTQTGLRENLSSCHIGYGTARGKVEDESVILASTDPVTMTSKVAIAYFEFKDGTTEGYSGAITLSGTNICNEMTVKFDGVEDVKFTGKEGTAGNAISLTDNTSSQKYVMLVPPANVGEETLEFGGAYEGTTTLYKGIEANKFYCVGAGVPIEVSVTPKPTPKFTVDALGTKVEFSPGNLYWDGSAFGFEENQWDTKPANGPVAAWDASHVSHFYWSMTASVACASSYSDSKPSMSDEFFTEALDFQVSGEMPHTWRTLSMDEWYHLLQERNDASSLWAWKELDGGTHKGLVILPDGTENPSEVLGSITKTSDLANHGAVFLPAAGTRTGTTVNEYGSIGAYWTSDPSDLAVDPAAWYVALGNAWPNPEVRSLGLSVRLVRTAS